MSKPLGRRTPETMEHVEKYPFASFRARAAPPESYKNLGLPWWWREHDQGSEGACVGFGSSAMMSITNHFQRLRDTGRDVTYRYDSRWLYQQSQLVDEWDETPPEEGTSVNASGKVLRLIGHRRVQPGGTSEPLLQHGIKAVRWATGVDEMRDALYNGMAISLGVNWYSKFDSPVLQDGRRWAARTTSMGFVRGGHCVCVFRYDDSVQGFGFMNSWGEEYAPAWFSYEVMDRLLGEWGEAALITDA